jgi:hypothetical protein
MDDAQFEEAHALMRKLAGERVPLSQELLNEQKEAKNRILSAILALNGYAGFNFQRYANDKENIVSVSLHHVEAWIVFHHSDRFRVVVGKQEIPVPLLWNVITKDFEGTEVDTYRAPVPGEVPKMRSAVSSIMYTLLTNFPLPAGRS